MVREKKGGMTVKAAQRKRAAWGDLLVALTVLALAAALAVVLFPRSQGALTAEVRVDGELVLTQRLDALREPLFYSVGGAYPLTLELSSEGVRVLETSCPGADCLHTGTISAAGRQIICLPNRMVVTLRGETPSYDAIAG